MNRRSVLLLLAIVAVALIPFRSPAPLIYTPGEGWVYEPAGGEGAWQRTRAKDQLIVAQDAFDKKDYGTARKAARRVIRVWPLSDYAPQAQYLIGRCYEAKGFDERAFKEYQKLLEKYPRFVNCEEVLKRQYDIANRYLAGQWFRLWDYIPFFPSMERTADMFAKVVKNGPYSDIAPQAQMKIGAAREKQENYPQAVKAYEHAADVYHHQPQIAADALFRAGLAYQKQAQTAEYDQGTAGQAIATFTDFMTLYPDDPRVSKATDIISELKREQARGNYEIAKFYESHKKWRAARTYYNEVQKAPDSPLLAPSLKKIEMLNQLIAAEKTQP